MKSTVLDGLTALELKELSALIDAGAHAELERKAREWLERHPRSGLLWKTLGAVLRLQGKDALQALRRATELMPSDAQAHQSLADTLHELGRHAEAVTRYRRALQCKPDFAEAHNNLGNALRALGQTRDAMASFRRALETLPHSPEAHNNLGNVLLDLGQPAEAAESYRTALLFRPDYAQAHSNLGAALLKLGDFAGAAASYQRALAIAPGSAEAYNNLGSALRNLGRLDEAAANYGRALEIDAGFAKAHSNLGGVLRLQGLASEAEASCRKALALEPDLAPALVLLAELHADKGQFAEAQALLERAVAVEPQFPQAWAGLARWRTMTRGDTAWLTQAQRLADGGLPPRDEVFLRYAIGKYFADVGAFEQAFASYQRANELEKRCKAKYDRALVTRAVDLLIRTCDRAWLTRTRSGAFDSERPVFIVGMPRSGTTLAEQILASHPAVLGAGELPFWGNRHGDVASALRDGANDGALCRLAEEYLRLLATLSSGAPRVIDKMPGNFMFLGLIRAALPRARIIHMRRDPLDTCLSIYFQHFETAAAYTNDLEDLAHYYSEYSRIMAHWRAILPADAMLEVPYEALVEDQRAWSRRLLEFIGLSWDERCIDFHRTERAIITASNWQVRQKISKASVGRWRSYAAFAGPLRKLASLGPLST